MPLSGSRSGSLRIRSSIGSRSQAIASSSIADSSANMPGHSPGARIHDGVGTSSATSRCRVRRSGAAYIMRVGVHGLLGELAHGRGLLEGVVGDRGQPAVAVAPRRTRWIVGVR